MKFIFNFKKKKKNKIFNLKEEHKLLYEFNHKKPYNRNFIATDWVIYAPNIYDIHKIKTSEEYSRTYTPTKKDSLKSHNKTFIAFCANGLKELSIKDIITILNNNNSLYICEDSFLRSIQLYYARKELDDKYTKPLAFTFDDLGFHYSCYYPTRIELLLKNSPELSLEQIKRAQDNITFIRNNYLTKYNYKPINLDFTLPGQQKEKVLVIGQKISDSSIINSNVPRNIFDIILQAAIKENPNADILFVDHPENKHHNLPNGLSLSDIPNLYILNNETNIPVLLEKIDKIYVCSSGVGLEAIIRGKKPIVFGVPFYAGWGLTEDRNEIFSSQAMQTRRKKTLSIEDLFYRTYIDYTIYRLPKEESICEIEDALEYLVKTREEYFADIKQNKINPTYK